MMQIWPTIYGNHSDVKYADIKVPIAQFCWITEWINYECDFPGSSVKEPTIPFIKKIKHVFVKVVFLLKAEQSSEQKVKEI